MIGLGNGNWAADSPSAPVTLTSDDLEIRNLAKGFADATVSAMSGDWRLMLASDVGIQALAYARHSDGAASDGPVGLLRLVG